jgi:formyltetrahydrofolate deformylase
MMKNAPVLRIHCPDRKGLIANVSGLLLEHGANITHADRHQYPTGLFFMRVEWALDGFDLPAFTGEFATLAGTLEMRWKLDLVDFEVHPVISFTEAVEKIGQRL